MRSTRPLASRDATHLYRKPPAMNIRKTLFGLMPDQQPVDCYRLESDAQDGLPVIVEILTYGSVIKSLQVPDRNGNLGDVVLGFDDLASYLTHNPFFGCIAGRYANRIAGGRFQLDQVEYTLACNNGPNHLHGGLQGFDKVNWQAESVQGTDHVALQLTYQSADREEGYPGQLTTTVTYTLNNQGELRIDYSAITNKPTILNLTNHTYFNLAGSGTVLDHVVMIDADRYTPVNADLIPTGALAPVTGTPFDFRTPTAIGVRIDGAHEQLRYGGGYDHNWVLNGTGLRHAITVTEASSGRRLEVATTQPGVQFYTGNMMPDALAGKGGIEYTKRSGFCLETQHFPDSPNQPHFPTVVLRPGEQFHESTRFRFGASD